MIHPVVSIMSKAAFAAGEIIRRGLDNASHVKFTEKQAHDYRSDIDVQAETTIIELLKQAYPQYGFIAEESGSQHSPDNPEGEWIIDPLDGTTNFLHGMPHVCIAIALRVKGHLEHSVIYDPLRDELFTASRGRGARLNERRLRVSAQTKLNYSLIGTGFPYRSRETLDEYLASFRPIFSEVSDIRCAGAAALDLAYVAAGRLDGFWECDLQIWDIAAGALLVREAGGLISDIDGAETHFTTGRVVAGNPKIFKALLQLLSKKS